MQEFLFANAYWIIPAGVALFVLAMKGLKKLAAKTENKVDDQVVALLDKLTPAKVEELLRKWVAKKKAK